MCQKKQEVRQKKDFMERKLGRVLSSKSFPDKETGRRKKIEVMSQIRNAPREMNFFLVGAFLEKIGSCGAQYISAF